ncbi:helix-turn-helix domain-containing protein [Streptomyces sp. NPDC057094]|uniref:helix-turn-helix domain-containing protein n=1 Tax=Streptomyces sp. NPDC057094 TaxID=3346018 RepID=UPI00362E9475
MRQRFTGEARVQLASDLKSAYENGESIRARAAEHGWSYGFVHDLLREAGTALWPRGGRTRLDDSVIPPHRRRAVRNRDDPQQAERRADHSSSPGR